MTLKHLHFIDLPPHLKPGGFDHAAVHRSSGHLYVAHTVNDALDVIDCANDRYLQSIPHLTGVAGVLASDERNLVFTSNRGENTVAIFRPGYESDMVKVNVGLHPNGLAYDPVRNLLLVANVGDPTIAGSFTASIVDVAQRTLIASIAVPGHPRWAIVDLHSNAFYVNIKDPAQIVVIAAGEPAHPRVTSVYDVPVAGPHGLDLDTQRRRLYCACDGGKLVTLDEDTGHVLDVQDIDGVPDVVCYNSALKHLYVAIGDPGVIDVFDTASMQRIESVTTEQGAHTIGLDVRQNKVYAFMPMTHRVLVYLDTV